MSPVFSHLLPVLAVAALLSAALPALGAKLTEVRIVDEEHIQIHFLDGEVESRDTGTGPNAFRGGVISAEDIVHRYEPPLDTTAATTTETYTITSADDPNYSNGLTPVAAYRKSKVNGTNDKHPEPDYTVEHTIYLKLPQKLRQGGHYALAIAAAAQCDTASKAFSFDMFSSVTEALHVNLIGYNPDHTASKAADLYMWLGSGGGRDYSAYVGRKVLLYSVATGKSVEVGTVAFWKKHSPEIAGHDLLHTDVWTCDFSAFNTPGNYRLAIEGIGCSPDFAIARDVYFEPFKTSVRGFYFMRLGEPKEFTPVPRQPRYIPGVDPENFKVYMTSYGPWHADWKMGQGDQWDVRDWSKYMDPGAPTNPNAYGGHSDATDWDRHCGHISIIWDLLLPYYLSNGKIGEDNLQIRESGNGIPDIIDEARNEVDFWQRLRDTKGGYSAGLNNPSNKAGDMHEKNVVMYQAAATPYMAWANAANAAMLADCFRIAGKPDLARQYTDAACEAWKIAGEEGLDLEHGIGNGKTRGRDLKFMAAAFLYNLTGEKTYEDVVAKESVATGPTAYIDDPKRGCQYWGTAAYLLCGKNKWQSIHYPELYENMRRAIIREALDKNAAASESRPSRRSATDAYGWFQTTQEVEAACIAHAVSADPAEKDKLLKALILEADWGLGRNPMNMVQMTGLGSRCVKDMYTCGRNDGVPGVHPGHTPYMNAEGWGNIHNYQWDPQWYAAKGFPEWQQWPHGEALWNAPYCFANNEFTPQQSMRGKMVLLGYLYALGESHKP